jgi:phage tail sheath gpL-like
MLYLKHTSARISAALSGSFSATDVFARNLQHTVVSLISLDKTPSIDIYYHTSGAAIAAQHVKPAHTLPKRLANLACPGLFLVTQVSNESDHWGKLAYLSEM